MPWMKPAAPARIHLLLAAVMWTLVGTGLFVFGARWVLSGAPRWAPALLAGAIIIGLLKAIFVLRRTAIRTIERIRARGDGRCLGGFLSPASWLLVVVMIVGGRFLRTSPLPHTVVGTIYVAVGTALFVASCRVWGAFLADRLTDVHPGA